MTDSTLIIEYRRGCCPDQAQAEAMYFRAHDGDLEDLMKWRVAFDGMVITAASASWDDGLETWEAEELHVHVGIGERITVEDDGRGPSLVISKVIPFN